MRSLSFMLITLIISCLAVAEGAAQVKHAIYYDADKRVIDDFKAAKFMEVIERESDQVEHGSIKLYKIIPDSTNYRLIKMGSYTSVFHPRKAHGQVISYYPNGKKQSLQTYENGTQHGLEMEWHENDSLKHMIGYKQGKYDGELKAFYSSGKLKREELYKDGEQIYGKCYTEDGQEAPFVVYREAPQYPGGEKALLAYFSKSMSFTMSRPPTVATGIIVVSFVIDKDGTIKNIQLLRKMEDDFDKRALRFVKKMEPWQPATFEGEKISTEYVMPLRFTTRHNSIN